MLVLACRDGIKGDWVGRMNGRVGAEGTEGPALGLVDGRIFELELEVCARERRKARS